MNFEIKKMHVADRTQATDVLIVIRQAYQPDNIQIGRHLPSQDTNLANIIADRSIFLGAYDKKTLIGFISYTLQDHTIDVSRLAVTPSQWREGVASRLLSNALNHHEGVAEINVSVAKENRAAEEFYRNHAFRVESEFSIKDNGEDLQMIKMTRDNRPWPIPEQNIDAKKTGAGVALVSLIVALIALAVAAKKKPDPTRVEKLKKKSAPLKNNLQKVSKSFWEEQQKEWAKQSKKSKKQIRKATKKNKKRLQKKGQETQTQAKSIWFDVAEFVLDEYKKAKK